MHAHLSLWRWIEEIYQPNFKIDEVTITSRCRRKDDLIPKNIRSFNKTLIFFLETHYKYRRSHTLKCKNCGLDSRSWKCHWLFNHKLVLLVFQSLRLRVCAFWLRLHAVICKLQSILSAYVSTFPCAKVEKKKQRTCWRLNVCYTPNFSQQIYSHFSGVARTGVQSKEVACVIPQHNWVQVDVLLERNRCVNGKK
jgi:hypothetical protein